MNAQLTALLLIQKLYSFLQLTTGSVTNWPLVEEENVGGSKRGHDPDQPAHVTRPGTQLTQVEPESQWNKK